MQAETTTGSSLQPADTKTYAMNTLRRKSHLYDAYLLEYGSALRMIDYLRCSNEHSNTLVTYLCNLAQICQARNKTPDEIIEETRTLNEDKLEDFFMELDKHWQARGNSPGTRRNKWATLSTFLQSNNIRKTRLVKNRIKNYRVSTELGITREDCKKMLDACTNDTDRLTVSLYIESLQRPSTIAALTWGDMLPHLQKGEDIFLIWIDAKRTKRNIPHWAPIGKLSTYYMQKVKAKLEEKRIEGKPFEIQNDTPLLISPHIKKPRPLGQRAIDSRLERLMERADIRGRGQREGPSKRYENRPYSFRSFGDGEMQTKGVNQEVIYFFMGHKTDSYTKLIKKQAELLEIYRANMPQLDPDNIVQELVDLARSRGFELDPKALQPLKCRDLNVHEDPRRERNQSVGAN